MKYFQSFFKSPLIISYILSTFTHQVIFECCSSTCSGLMLLPGPSYAFLMESAKLRLPPKRLLQKSPIVSESQTRSRQSEIFSCTDKTAVLQPNSAYPVSNGINTQHKTQTISFPDQKIGTECTREQFICMDIPMEKMCCHICRTVMTFP